MPDLHKKVLVAVTVGAVLGWFLTAFVFYPPHSNWDEKLKFGDIGTWIGAFATFVAAFTALKISRDQATREEQRFKRRAEVHAAYLVSDLGLLYKQLEVVQRFARAVKPSIEDDDNFHLAVSDLVECGNQLEVLAKRVDMQSISQLPDECAASTAGAYGAIRQIGLHIATVAATWDRSRDRKVASKSAALIANRALLTRKSMVAYIDYVNEKFNAGIEGVLHESEELADH